MRTGRASAWKTPFRTRSRVAEANRGYPLRGFGSVSKIGCDLSSIRCALSKRIGDLAKIPWKVEAIPLRRRLNSTRRSIPSMRLHKGVMLASDGDLPDRKPDLRCRKNVLPGSIDSLKSRTRVLIGRIESTKCRNESMKCRGESIQNRVRPQEQRTPPFKVVCGLKQNGQGNSSAALSIQSFVRSACGVRRLSSANKSCSRTQFVHS